MKRKKLKTITEAFTKARITKGLTGAELARKIEVSKQAIYLIERGESNPSPANAQKICETLDKQFDELFYLE